MLGKSAGKTVGYPEYHNFAQFMARKQLRVSVCSSRQVRRLTVARVCSEMEMEMVCEDLVEQRVVPDRRCMTVGSFTLWCVKTRLLVTQWTR